MRLAPGRGASRMRHPPRPAIAILILGLAAMLAACRPAPEGGEQAPARRPLAATRPAPAVRPLPAHLRASGLEAFASEAVPPELRARLRQAWAEGRTRWPLDELPF